MKNKVGWFTFPSDGFCFVIFLVDTSFVFCPINAEEFDITLVSRSSFKCQSKASETKIIMAAIPRCNLLLLSLMAHDLDKLIKFCLSGYFFFSLQSFLSSIWKRKLYFIKVCWCCLWKFCFRIKDSDIGPIWNKEV